VPLRVLVLEHARRSEADGAQQIDELARGQSRDEIAATLFGLRAWLEGSTDDPCGWGLEALAPARSRVSRHGAILLPFRALLAAIEDQAT